MMNLNFISMCNILHAMFVVHNIDSDITKDMIILKHIIKCHIIFVWKKIVLTKSLLLLRLQINWNYTECKYMKNKGIKKLILNNYVGFSLKGKIWMNKLSLLKINKVLIWNLSIYLWKKLKTEFLMKLIDSKINTLMSETFIIVSLIRMNMLKKYSQKELLIRNKQKSKKINQNKNKRVQPKTKKKNIYQNNRLKKRKFKSH